MAKKVTVRQALDVDQPNAYRVTISTNADRETLTVHTNKAGEGLWIDGRQMLGTSQFSVGKNPNAAIRKYFETSWGVP